MEHILYFDGNLKKISWVILTESQEVTQSRVHVEKYKDKITKIQSKYVALHIALFWGIGTFKIKNEDNVKIKLDEEIMFDQLNSKTKSNDEFIENKIKFIQSFIKQRKLRVYFEKINTKNNLSNKFLK
ncbi:MAG: hypothetical protein HPQ69_02175 [Marine Group I thaumarchaeote]|nr:MAG: hypothetical protein HPQ69_02175 [Marine Group I thaumarchaeote]